MPETSSGRRAGVTRRAALGGLLAASALSACGSPKGGLGAGASGARPAEAAETGSFTTAATALEQRYGAEVGVFALDTGSGRTLEHRADQRFMLCSVFKGLAAAAMLRTAQDDPGLLARTAVIPSAGGEIANDSAAFGDKAGQAATYSELCRAAVQVSDNIAANLILDVLGGPGKLTEYIRTLGDETTRIDRAEEALNFGEAADLLDTTTPRAIAGAYRTLLLGSALAPTGRGLLTDWMAGTTSGLARIRAGLPPHWRIADKTGTGPAAQGELHDVAVAWPNGASQPPVVLAVLTRTPPPRQQQERLIADVASAAKTALGR